MATEIKAEITGNLWKIVKEVGQEIAAGETVAIMESMKMEIPVESPVAGKISEFLAQEGQIVQDGQTIALVEPT